MTIFSGFAAGVFVFFILFLIVNKLLSVKPYKGPVTKHFNGKTFRNPSKKGAKGFKDIFKLVTGSRPQKWERSREVIIRKETPPSPNPNDIQYCFVNHSTFLIQHAGLNILTDPIWSKRCSPFQFMGPGRQRPPGLLFEKLPKIDIVIVSHNHYDHMDKETIKKLIAAHNPRFVTALGLGYLIEKWGSRKVTEVDWWQEMRFKNLKIRAVPANHFSSRGAFDRDTTQWAGFIIDSGMKKIYFLGDSGYSDVFKEIAKREAPIDLSFIPIGAYTPRWFMSPIHMDPEQAVRAHMDVESKQSVAMHFGTFKLTDESPEQAIREFEMAKVTLGLNTEEFIVPIEGVVAKA